MIKGHKISKWSLKRHHPYVIKPFSNAYGLVKTVFIGGGSIQVNQTATVLLTSLSSRYQMSLSIVITIMHCSRIWIQ